MNLNAGIPYNESKLLNDLGQLKIEKGEDGKIITTYNNENICTSERSQRYGVFDVHGFVSGILPSINEIFKPEKYSLKIERGIQEIKFFGGLTSLKIGDTVKSLSIMSSSNGQKSLQIIAGLVRVICTNGMVIWEKDQNLQIITKHFESTLPEKIQYFEEKLLDLPIHFDKQIEYINKLNDSPVSLVELANKLIINEKLDTGNNVSPSGLIRFRLLVDKLRNSETDRLDSTKLTAEQHRLLYMSKPMEYLNNKIDIEVPKQQLFNCYTEIYRDRHTDIIRKESTRIYDLIN